MIVVDSSVAFKWFKEEAYNQEANVLLQNHLTATNRILVPPLIFLEIANALVTKTLTTLPTIKKDLRQLSKFNLEIYQPTTQDLLKTSQLAKKYHTSVYDMLYAVIAQKHNCPLITTDDRFIAKTNFRFVTHLKNIPLTTSPV